VSLKIKPRIGAKDFGAAVWLSPTLVWGFVGSGVSSVNHAQEARARSAAFMRLMRTAEALGLVRDWWLAARLELLTEWESVPHCLLTSSRRGLTSRLVDQVWVQAMCRREIRGN